MTTRREGHTGKDRRTGRWYAVIDVHAPGEPRRQRWSRGHRTRTDALRQLDRLRSEVNAGNFTDAAGITVGEWCRQWLDLKEPRLKPATFDKYRRDVETHIVPGVGSIRLDQLRVEHLDTFYSDLLNHGGKRPNGPRGRDNAVVAEAVRLRNEGRTYKAIADHLTAMFPRECAGLTRHAVAGLVRRADTTLGGRRRTPLSPTSVRHVHRLLKQALGYAVKTRRIAANPADHAEVPSVARARHTVWGPADARRFLETTCNDRHHALWTLLLLGMCRRGEALGLRWDDVDLDAGTATIRRTLGRVGSQVLVTNPKTDAGHREIALAAPVVESLRTWRAVQASERLMIGAGWQDDGWVFTTPTGASLQPEAVSRRFQRITRDHGLPRLRLHELRHTGATLALEAGTDIRVLSDQVGHATTTVTRDMYQHVNAGMRADTVARVTALLEAHGR